MKTNGKRTPAQTSAALRRAAAAITTATEKRDELIVERHGQAAPLRTIAEEAGFTSHEGVRKVLARATAAASS